LKLSHFQAIAAAKQLTKSMSMHMVPKYSHVIVLSNVPCWMSFQCVNSALAACVYLKCGDQVIFIPCASKLLRNTTKKGGDSRLFKISVERTPSLKVLRSPRVTEWWNLIFN
jgi:hypothetical protein